MQEQEKWELPIKAFAFTRQFLILKEVQSLSGKADDLQCTFTLEKSRLLKSCGSKLTVILFIVRGMEIRGENIINTTAYGESALKKIKDQIIGKEYIFKTTQNKTKKNSLYGIAPRFTMRKSGDFVLQIFQMIGISLSKQLKEMVGKTQLRCIYELIRKLNVMHEGSLNDIEEKRICHLDIKTDNIVSLFTDEDRKSLKMERNPYQQTKESILRGRYSCEQKDRQMGVFTFIDFDSSASFEDCVNESALKVNGTGYYQCPTIKNGQIFLGKDLQAKQKFERLAKCDVYSLGVVILEILLKSQLRDLQQYKQKWNDENVVPHELVMKIMGEHQHKIMGEHQHKIIDEHQHKLNMYYKILKHMLNPNPDERWSIERVLSEVYHEFFYIQRNPTLKHLVIKQVVSCLDMYQNGDSNIKQLEYYHEINDMSDQTKKRFLQVNQNKTLIPSDEGQGYKKFFRYKTKGYLERVGEEDDVEKVVFLFFDFDVLSLATAYSFHKVQILFFSDCKLNGIPLLKNFPSLKELSILGRRNFIKSVDEALCECYKNLIKLDLSLTRVESFTTKSVQNIQCLKFNKCYSLALPEDLPDSCTDLEKIYFQGYDSGQVRSQKETIDLMKVLLEFIKSKGKVYEQDDRQVTEQQLQGKLYEMEMEAHEGINSKLSQKTTDSSQQQTLWLFPFRSNSLDEPMELILSKHSSQQYQQQNAVESTNLTQSGYEKTSGSFEQQNGNTQIESGTASQGEECTAINVPKKDKKRKSKLKTICAKVSKGLKQAIKCQAKKKQNN